MAKENKALSLEDLDATTAGEKPFEFEVVDVEGEGTGIWLSVFGGESAIVQSETARLQNARRRQAAAREATQKIGVHKKVEIIEYESDVDYGKRVSAVRLAGWRGAGQTEGLTAEQKARFCGISAPFTPENALRLCQRNALIAAQVTEQSEATGNFMKL
jgi:hypothetical protein